METRAANGMIIIISAFGWVAWHSLPEGQALAVIGGMVVGMFLVADARDRAWREDALKLLDLQEKIQKMQHQINQPAASLKSNPFWGRGADSLDPTQTTHD
jgi:hypothetical protein